MQRKMKCGYRSVSSLLQQGVQIAALLNSTIYAYKPPCYPFAEREREREDGEEFLSY